MNLKPKVVFEYRVLTLYLSVISNVAYILFKVQMIKDLLYPFKFNETAAKYDLRFQYGRNFYEAVSLLF